jgi:hypothetical protein
MPRRWMSGATRANPRGRQLICCSKPHDDIVLASEITARRPLRTTTRERRGRLLLLGKGAVLTHRLARPLAAESDETEQWCSGTADGEPRYRNARSAAARRTPKPRKRRYRVEAEARANGIVGADARCRPIAPVGYELGRARSPTDSSGQRLAVIRGSHPGPYGVSVLTSSAAGRISVTSLTFIPA